jgi:glutamate synthase domain-containing protein 3
LIEVDLARSSVRTLNERLHHLTPRANELHWRVLNPAGAHNIAVGITQRVDVEIKAHVGYYCAGMNAAATVVVDGHAGTGLAENIMSGLVRVSGNASQSAAASGRGGFVVIEGSAGARLPKRAHAAAISCCVLPVASARIWSPRFDELRLPPAAFAVVVGSCRS